MAEKYRGGILLPGEASTALSVISFLFISSGAVLLLLAGVVTIGKLLDWSAVAGITPARFELASTAAFGVGYLWIGALLLQAKRSGALLALAVAGVQVLAVLLSPPISVGGLIKPALMAVAIVLAWPHLSREGRKVDAPTSITARAG
jgi:hypothetical protein